MICHDQVKRPTRRRRYPRTFVAILIGIITWWGTYRILAPKPLYTLRFPVLSDSHKLNRERFMADAIDRSGRLALIQQWIDDIRDPSLQRPDDPPHPPVVHERHLKLLDLETGKVVAHHVLPNTYRFNEGTLLVSSMLFPWSGADGELYVRGTVNETGGSSRNCLWSWNMITNRKQLLAHYHYNTRLFPSKDGRVLVENQKIPLSLFQALIPGSILGVVANEATTNAWALQPTNPNAGISIWNTWLLPGRIPRGTIVLPSYADSAPYHVSDDGRWLVLYDDFFESAMKETYQPKDQQDKIRIYDMETGKLWTELTLPYGTLSDRHYMTERLQTVMSVPVYVNPINSNVRTERLERRKNQIGFHSITSAIRTDYNRYYHIPSKTWLSMSCDTGDSHQVPFDIDGSIRWLGESINPLGHWTIYSTDLQGMTTKAGVIDHETRGFDPHLVAHSSLIVMTRHSRSSLPDWIDNYLRRFDQLRDWLVDDKRKELVVYDYQASKVLWKLDINDEQQTRVAVTPTGSFLIVNRDIDGMHEVTVLKFPLPRWTAWWSASIGVFGMAVVLWLLHRRCNS